MVLNLIEYEVRVEVIIDQIWMCCLRSRDPKSKHTPPLSKKRSSEYSIAHVPVPFAWMSQTGTCQLFPSGSAKAGLECDVEITFAIIGCSIVRWQMGTSNP
jgi:hypothetical protein